MVYATIKIYEILAGDLAQFGQKDFIELDNHNPPSLLILNTNLAQLILKNEVLHPDFISYWKFINNKDNQSYPAIEEYFKKTPLSLFGQDHLESRKMISNYYKLIENNLDNWIHDYTISFFSSLDSSLLHDPTSVSRSFISGVFRKLIEEELECDFNSLPELPGDLFHLFPSAHTLDAYNQKLALLLSFIEEQLIFRGKDIQDTWAIVSTAVMGSEPLYASLVFGILIDTENDELLTTEAIFNKTNPISIIQRIVAQDFVIDNYNFKKKQLLYTSPFISRMLDSENNGKDNYISPFGYGIHVCPGKKISFMIVDAFFNALKKRKNIIFDKNKISFKRDFFLRPIKNDYEI